eukprot:ctg_3005.g536
MPHRSPRPTPYGLPVAILGNAGGRQQIRRWRVGRIGCCPRPPGAGGAAHGGDRGRGGHAATVAGDRDQASPTAFGVGRLQIHRPIAGGRGAGHRTGAGAERVGGVVPAAVAVAARRATTDGRPAHARRRGHRPSGARGGPGQRRRQQPPPA